MTPPNLKFTGIASLYTPKELKAFRPCNNGLKGPCHDKGTGDAFILFTNNRAYCHDQATSWNAIELAALKQGILRCADGRQTGEPTPLTNEQLTELQTSITNDYGESFWTDLKKAVQTYEPVSKLSLVRPDIHKKISIRGIVVSMKNETLITGYILECDNKKCLARIESTSKRGRKCNECRTENEDGTPITNGFMNIAETINESGFMLTLIDDYSDYSNYVGTLHVFAPQSDITDPAQFLAITSTNLKVDGFLKMYTQRVGGRETIAHYLKADNIEIITNTNSQHNIDLKPFQRTWTNDEIDQLYAPDLVNIPLAKKVVLLVQLSPREIIPGIRGMGAFLLIGDGGEGKSALTISSINQLQGLPAMKINAEQATKAGLTAAIKKESDGTYNVERGAYPACHGGFVVNDGIHTWDAEQLANLREMRTEGKVTINKVSKAKLPAEIRTVDIANCRMPINGYPTRYDATFDIGYNILDDANKLSNTADRRRYDCAVVVASEDVPRESVFKKVIEKLRGATTPTLPWRDLVQTAWSLTPQQIIYAEAVDTLITEQLAEWNKNYTADFGIFGKTGVQVFLKYAVASAVLHGSFDERGNVHVSESDVVYVTEFFEEIFRNLELDIHADKTEELTALAEAIAKSLNEEQRKAVLLIAKHGSLRSADRSGEGPSRVTMWKTLKQHNALIGEGLPAAYSPSQGSGEIRYYWQDKVEKEAFSPDGKVEPLYADYGRLTKLGHAVILALNRLTNLTTIITLKEKKESKKKSNYNIYSDAVNGLDGSSGKASVMPVTEHKAKSKRLKKPSKAKTEREEQYYENAKSKELLKPAITETELEQKIKQVGEAGMSDSELITIRGALPLAIKLVKRGKVRKKDEMYYVAGGT